MNQNITKACTQIARRFCKWIDNSWFNHKIAIICALCLVVMSLGACVAGNCDAITLLDKIQNIVLCFLGGVACVYVWHSVKIFWCRPIKRDWMLSKGNYVFRVVMFVLAVPISIAFIINTGNAVGNLSGRKGLEYSHIFYVSHMHGDDMDEDSKCNICEKYDAEDHTPSLSWIVFYHFVDPGNQHSTLSLVGRIIAGLCAVLGVLLLNGLLVSVLIGWFDSKREKWKNGEARYTKYLSKHKPYVIIGGGKMDAYIVKSIFDDVDNGKTEHKKYPYIVILTPSNAEELRNNIYSVLPEDSKQRHVVIYQGSRISKDNLMDLNIECAREVYILGETHSQESAESMHDTYNMRCLEYVADLIPQKEEKTVVYVMFEHQTTFSIYQFSEISDKIKNKIEFRPVNFYEMWAQKVLVNRSIEIADSGYLPLDGKDGISADSDEFAHIVIFGMSRMGVALGIETAHLAHYPNFITKHKRTRITFVDENMRQERNFFMGRFKSLFELARHRYVSISNSAITNNVPRVYDDETHFKWVNPMDSVDEHGNKIYEHLGDDFIDVEWEFINGSIESPGVQQYLVDASNNSNAKLTIAMCYADPNEAAAAAIYLPREIYNSDRLLQVLVYQRYDDSLFSNLSPVMYKTPFHGKIKPFGMISHGFDKEWIKVCTDAAAIVGETYGLMGVFEQMLDGKMVLTNKSDDVFDICGLVASRVGVLKNVFNYVGQFSVCPTKDDNMVQTVEDVVAAYDKCLEEIRKMPGHKNEKKLRKAKVAGDWSNVYNANSLWAKCRSLNQEPYKCATKLYAYNIMLMSMVEHNRWNVEQLLMTYQPLTKREQDIFIQSMTKTKSVEDKVRNMYKAQMKHPNICSCDRLFAIDVKQFNPDVYITVVLQLIHDKFKLLKNEESGNS